MAWSVRCPAPAQLLVPSNSVSCRMRTVRPTPRLAMLNFAPPRHTTQCLQMLDTVRLKLVMILELSFLFPEVLHVSRHIP